MELYSIYQLVYFFMGNFLKRTERTCVLWSVPIGAGLWLGLFILQGVGIYTMAKRRKMNHKFLAFVPFANIFYLGKIAGECGFFGQRMKNAGLYAMIAEIITSILTVLYLLSNWYLYFRHGTPIYTEAVSLISSPHWPDLQGFSRIVYNFCFYAESFLAILRLITLILLVLLLGTVYKKYSPRSQQGLTLLSFFIPEARYIVIFALRNREPVDYEAYVRRQREEYMRRQQQYYNTYGNPYGGYRGGQNPYGGQPTPPPQNVEEPFEEFSSGGNQNAQNGRDAQDEDSDGFFD